MKDESKRQELASRLVQREVYCCASMLMSGIARVMHTIPYRDFNNAFDTDADSLMDLYRSRDFEEAARRFITDDADVGDLETVADKHGFWSNIVDEHVPKLIATTDDDGDIKWGFEGEPVFYDDEDDAQENAIESVMPKLRVAVWGLVDSAGAYEDVCNEHNLDPDENEVYEHWVVSDWLQKKLAESGECTGDFAGLSIWGRCCTGQSISLDYVIQRIAIELWSEEAP